jgi:hypothetical protein
MFRWRSSVSPTRSVGGDMRASLCPGSCPLRDAYRSYTAPIFHPFSSSTSAMRCDRFRGESMAVAPAFESGRCHSRPAQSQRRLESQQDVTFGLPSCDSPRVAHGAATRTTHLATKRSNNSPHDRPVRPSTDQRIQPNVSVRIIIPSSDVPRPRHCYAHATASCHVAAWGVSPVGHSRLPRSRLGSGSPCHLFLFRQLPCL